MEPRLLVAQGVLSKTLSHMMIEEDGRGEDDTGGGGRMKGAGGVVAWRHHLASWL